MIRAKSKPRGAMVTITCACGCGRDRSVRAADLARGWGRFYDKSCKAKWQAQQKKLENNNDVQ